MKTTTITMTREFKAALRMAYFCCREIGHRNQSDYEIERQPSVLPNPRGFGGERR
jgi:hypothetical protein